MTTKFAVNMPANQTLVWLSKANDARFTTVHAEAQLFDTYAEAAEAAKTAPLACSYVYEVEEVSEFKARKDMR